jgi:hypothetical protein
MEGNQMEVEMWQSTAINELAQALVKAQTSMKPAKREATNPFFHSKYADLPTCWEATDSFRENGIAIVQCPMPSDEKTMALDTVLLHVSGQWMRSRLLMPMGKLDPQGAGSAITYARRYALGCMTGLVTDEDNDGNQPAQPSSKPAYKPVPKPAVAPAQSPVGGASEAAQPPVALDAPIIWNAGKPPHRGKNIREVDGSYLKWYETNGPQDEYRVKASQELDRRDLEHDANREMMP